MGMIIGGGEFVTSVLEQAERRGEKPSMERKRASDFFFEPVAKVLQEFEKVYKLKLEELDTRTYRGKRLRGELLVQLKERAGLKYMELAKMEYFSDLSINGLGTLYKRARERKK